MAGGFLNDSGLFSNIDTSWSQPTNQFQGQAAQGGLGVTNLNEQNFLPVATQAITNQTGVTTGQNNLAGLLGQESTNGNFNNLQEQQLAMGTQMADQQAAGAMASARGINPALAERSIADQNQANAMALSGQAGQARLQQQLSAQEQLAGVYGQQQQGNLNELATAIGANQGQNALNLSNQQNAQGVNANVAAQNAQLNLGAQQADIGINTQAGQIVGGAAQGVGSAAAIAAMASEGAIVPGTAKVPGNSPENDTKPYMLSPGEVVLPRTVAEDPMASMGFLLELKRQKGSKQLKN